MRARVREARYPIDAVSEPNVIRVSSWKLVGLMLGAGVVGGFMGQLAFFGLVILLLSVGRLVD